MDIVYGIYSNLFIKKLSTYHNIGCFSVFSLNMLCFPLVSIVVNSHDYCLLFLVIQMVWTMLMARWTMLAFHFVLNHK